MKFTGRRLIHNLYHFLKADWHSFYPLLERFWGPGFQSFTHEICHRSLLASARIKEKKYILWPVKPRLMILTSDNHYCGYSALPKNVWRCAFINAPVATCDLLNDKNVVIVSELSPWYTGISIFTPCNRRLRISSSLTSQYYHIANLKNGSFRKVFDVGLTCYNLAELAVST